MTVSLIAAVAENGVIGRDNGLPSMLIARGITALRAFVALFVMTQGCALGYSIAPRCGFGAPRRTAQVRDRGV